MWYLDPEEAPKQVRSIADSTARINIWEGSVRSGKTVAANLRWLEYALNRRDGDLLMVGKTERTLKRNVLDNFKQFLTTRRYDINRGDGEVFFCGRKIHIVGANDERATDKIQGSTYAGAYVDEISLVPESFFSMLLSRLSAKGAKLFGTTNPDSPYHWLKTDYLDRAGELNIRSWKFRLEDNPFLDPDYVENLKREYTGLWHRRYIEGMWVLAAGAIYDMFDEEAHVTDLEGRAIEQAGRWIVDCDYGTSNPCTWSLKAIWHEGGKPRVHTVAEYYWDSEIEGRQKTDTEYADDMEAWLNEWRQKVASHDGPGAPVGNPRIYVDPSAASFINELKGRGLSVRPADNAVIDGIRFVASMLTEGRYTIAPRCEQTPKSYASYVWDETAQKRGEDKPLKEHDHCCDRDRYGLYTELQKRQSSAGKTATAYL